MSVIRPSALIVLALALAACGSQSKPADEAEPTTANTTTTAGCKPPAGMATSPQVSPTPGDETMYLTNVTAHTDHCGDRITFDFKKSGAPGPGFKVSYEPAASAKLEDGSGKPIEIEGSAFLVVRLAPAMTAEISGEEVKPTYTGPRRIRPEGFSFVLNVVKTGDFESVVTWVIGLEEKRPFGATASKTQLVVEIPES